MEVTIYVTRILDLYNCYISDLACDLVVTKISINKDGLIFITFKGNPLALFWLGYNYAYFTN